MPGRQPEAQLVEQRQQERQPTDPEAGDESAHDRNAERAQPEQRQAQQRKRDLARVPAVSGQQAHRDQQQDPGRGRIDVVLAEDLQQPRQQRDAATEQHQADQVERSRGLAAIVGHVASDDEQRGQADRHIDEEDVAP